MRFTGNLVTANGRTVAWYRLAPQRVAWLTEDDIDHHLVVPAAQVLAQLVDHRLHYRVTSTHLTLGGWQTRLQTDPVPEVARHVAGLDLADKACYVGVELPRRTTAGLFAGLWGQRRVHDLDRLMARPGFDARPLEQDETEWLLRRSTLLGHPNPVTSGVDAPFDDDDMPEIFDRAILSAEPYDRTVKIVNRDTLAERYAVTCVIGRSQTQHSLDPWLARPDRLGFPVEISVTCDILPAESVQRGLRYQISRALSQKEHHEEHKTPPEPRIQAGIQKALEVQTELDRGWGTELDTRLEMWVRITVTGATPDEALDRAQHVRDSYSPHIVVERPTGQAHLALEHRPGSPLSNHAHRRRGPVKTLAGAIPQATAMVGHHHGWYVGYTRGAGGRHAALWDPWRAMEVRERSGLAAVVGQPGCGKSSLLGMVAYRAKKAGVESTVLDPSGPLAAIADRHIDLLNARPGILNPWRLIPDPYRGHFDSDAEYQHARELAATTKLTLAEDVLVEMLPRNLSDQADTRSVIHQACRQASLAPAPSPGLVLDRLRLMAKDDDDPGLRRQARIVGDRLADLATLPAAQLIFESGQRIDLDDSDAGRPTLTVITMNGLQIPREDSDRRDWSTDETLALPLLHLAAWLVQRSVYHGRRDARKLVCFDEVHALSRIGAGRLLLNTSARDSRKWNTRVILASQNAADLLDAGIANLVDCCWIGTTRDRQAQTEALRLAGIEPDVGFEQALGHLSAHTRGVGRSGTREFVWADGEGGCERVAVDLRCLPAAVRSQLDTTADPSRVAA